MLLGWPVAVRSGIDLKAVNGSATPIVHILTPTSGPGRRFGSSHRLPGAGRGTDITVCWFRLSQARVIKPRIGCLINLVAELGQDFSRWKEEAGPLLAGNWVINYHRDPGWLRAAEVRASSSRTLRQRE
jgi:hypothetical protein